MTGSSMITDEELVQQPPRHSIVQRNGDLVADEHVRTLSFRKSKKERIEKCLSCMNGTIAFFAIIMIITATTFFATIPDLDRSVAQWREEDQNESFRDRPRQWDNDMEELDEDSEKFHDRNGRHHGGDRHQGGRGGGRHHGGHRDGRHHDGHRDGQGRHLHPHGGRGQSNS
jgi:hypothetical protein